MPVLCHLSWYIVFVLILCPFVKNVICYCECSNTATLLYYVVINRSTCVTLCWLCSNTSVDWSLSSWFLARCCSVKDILAKSVYRIHRCEIPSARWTAKYDMLFSSAGRQCCKHCHAAGLTSQLRLSCFCLSTTIIFSLQLCFLIAQ